MEHVFIVDRNGQRVNVEAIRYFKIGENPYFIYSMDELDGLGYVKLYVAKMKMENGILKNVPFLDDNEWNQFKEIMKTIVKEVREGNVVSVEDLDYRVLEDFNITEPRIFKLSAGVSETLGSNKKNFDLPEPEMEAAIENVNLPATSDPVPVEIKTESVVEEPSVSSEEQDMYSVETPVEVPSIPPIEVKAEEISPINDVSQPLMNPNETVIESEALEPIVIAPVPTEPVSIEEKIDYEKLYLEEHEKNIELADQCAQLLEAVNGYKAQLDEIRKLVS